MADPLTGEPDGISGFTSSGEGIRQNTNVQEARCEYYDLTHDRSGVLRKSRLRERAMPTQRSEAARTAADRYAVRKYVDDARQESLRMELAARQGDVMALACAGIALMGCLQELWAMRNVREEEWRSVANFLQAALTKEEFERFSVEQCKIVHTIIVNYLGGGLLGDQDVLKARMMLRKAGLDPWKAMSASQQEP